MEIEKDEITIRDFTETDLPLMFKWLTDKRVLSDRKCLYAERATEDINVS